MKEHGGFRISGFRFETGELEKPGAIVGLNEPNPSFPPRNLDPVSPPMDRPHRR